MRIPPLYRQPNWQRFLSGMAIGGIISWFIFIYMFGVMQEKQSTLINKQMSEISELNKEKEYWQGEFKKINEELENELTIQEIQVKLLDNKKIKLSSLQKANIEKEVSDLLSVIKAKKLESVSESKGIIKKAIEEKILTVDSKRYRLTVEFWELSTKVYIEVSIDLA
ncbi:hypothetical protein GCM10008967_24870 [Bacillus carboniphilus]|uniref:Sporulation membrane protein YtrI C-terminal domain-containing protein n=1 Tax=Bacillus carboniphilus TaxID=86663 RepID=A0ABP3G1T3_9BACI